MRATVPDQIELDIAPTAVQLMRTFSFAVGCVFAFFNDWHVGLQKCVAYTLQNIKAFFTAKFREVIKENTANTALFVAMF